MNKTSVRYLRSLSAAHVHLEQAVIRLAEANYHARDEHQRMGTSDLRQRASKLREDVSSLNQVAAAQASAESVS